MSTTNQTPAKRPTLGEIIAIITAIVAAVGGIIGLFSTIKGAMASPEITVNNHLALPILVKVNENESYTRRIEAGASYTFKLLSDKDFPAKVSWELIRNRNGSSFIGIELKASYPQVDKGKEIDITNVIAGNTYFYPKVSNKTGKVCQIIVNDGLVIQENLGYARDGSIIGITGYYKYASNSNITLYCENIILWRGERIGKGGDRILVTKLSGISNMSFP